MPNTTELPRLTPEQRAVVEANIGLVRQIAWGAIRRLHSAVELDDLVGVGYLALCSAAARYPLYCESRGYSSTGKDAERYIGAYLTKRVKGAILDYLRAQDTLTRSARLKLKLATAAEDRGVRVEEDDQLRRARAAHASRPVSLDAVTVGEGDASVQMSDISADVESRRLVDEITGTVITTMRKMPLADQLILALAYVHQMEVREIAGLLSMSEAKVSARHVDGVLAVHDQMLAVVSTPE